MLVVTDKERGMELFTPDQYEQLIFNGKSGQAHLDVIPVAYIVCPKHNYSWLVTELYEHDPNLAFGLSQFSKINTRARNLPTPKFGLFSLNDIDNLVNSGGQILNNLGFTTGDKISVFKSIADELGFLVANEEGFSTHFRKYRLE
ncbi:MAG: DUF2958 domain-containing protein [Flavipsychrobacter sp.]